MCIFVFKGLCVCFVKITQKAHTHLMYHTHFQINALHEVKDLSSLLQLAFTENQLIFVGPRLKAILFRLRLRYGINQHF